MTPPATKGEKLFLLAAAVLAAAAALLAPATAEASRYLPQALEPVTAPAASLEDLAGRDAEHLPALPTLTAADRLDLVDLAAGTRLEAHRLSLHLASGELGAARKTASGGQTWALEDNVKPISEMGAKTRRLIFQGLWTDPVTGLSYARARWYDARNASWLSEDPLLDVDSPNLYAFVGWGPHVGTDPLGLADRLSERLFVPQGYLYSSYSTAKEEAWNPDNPLWQRSVFGALHLLSAPIALTEEYVGRSLANTPHRAVANVEAGSDLMVEGVQEGDPAKVSVGTSYYCAAFVELAAVATPWSSEVRAMRAPTGPSTEPLAPPTSGDTAAARSGREIHRTLANERRLSGQWDEVNTAIADSQGTPIEVPRRVNLKTGEPVPEAGTQVARPDAVRYQNRLVLDDKPLTRDVMKDRQEIIRFIRAYEARQGALPETIAIQRYDPLTGLPVRTDLFKPEDFLPSGGS